jgi:hypothetical protein
MKKSHRRIVLVTVLAVAVVVVVAGTGVWETDGTILSAGSSAGPQADGSNAMTVESVSIRNQTANGVVSLDIGVAGDLDRAILGRALERMYDDPTTNVSDIELLDVRRNGATVTIATDGRDSSAHVAARVDQYLDGIAPNGTQPENPTTRTNHISAEDDSGAGSTSDSGAESTQERCDSETVFYQLDFVAGEPIETLRGPEGYYTPDRLLRFAHGSTEQPIVRSSDGEFTTNRTLRRSVESRAVTVENGTATITFSVAAGHEPVELTLASYEKPGRFWSPGTESEQRFADADTETFGPGGPYTLRVALPEAASAPCESSKEGENTRKENNQATGSAGTLGLTIDGRSGDTIDVEESPLENGGTFEDCATIKNDGNVTGDTLYIRFPESGLEESENGIVEPEEDAGDTSPHTGELSKYLSVKGSLGSGGAQFGYVPLNRAVGDEIEVSVNIAPGESSRFCYTVKLDESNVDRDNANDAMSDSAQFDIVLTLERNPSSGGTNASD